MICPLCDEINIRRQNIFNTEHSVVFYSIRPANKGQCIVVPRRHVTNIRELDVDEAADLMESVRHVSTILKSHLRPEGFNYGFNEGSISGQTIEHLHFHVLPRFKDDNLPEFHLFHREPKNKKNLSHRELVPIVKEFRKVFDFNSS